MAKKRRKKAAAKSKPAAKKRVAKKRKKKRSAKQQAASRRNIKKARAALGQKTKRKTKRKATKKRKSPKRVAAGKKAAAAKKRYARQRSAYAPALSPALAAQQLRHRIQAKREDRALARMKSDLLKGARRKTKAKPRALTLAQKADLALLALNARTTKQRSALKGIVKASAMDTPNQLRLFRKLTGTENPRRRRKRRNPELYANPRRRSRARTRRRNPGLALQWWIADLYKNGRKQTFIDAATKLQAEYSARQLAARNPGASVELSGPYATQPTASTARR